MDSSNGHNTYYTVRTEESPNRRARAHDAAPGREVSVLGCEGGRDDCKYCAQRIQRSDRQPGHRRRRPHPADPPPTLNLRPRSITQYMRRTALDLIMPKGRLNTDQPGVSILFETDDDTESLPDESASQKDSEGVLESAPEGTREPLSDSALSIRPGMEPDDGETQTLGNPDNRRGTKRHRTNESSASPNLAERVPDNHGQTGFMKDTATNQWLAPVFWGEKTHKLYREDADATTERWIELQ